MTTEPVKSKDLERKPRVLIADDEPANIAALVAVLRDAAELVIARHGQEAFERACATPPDLLLLDIEMPHLDGYAVCRRARATPTLCNVPVIFITHLHAEQDECRGFEAGANDYITKPFSPALVLARVRTQIELKRHRDDLEALAEARARQLVHAERLATLGTLAAGVAHEIRNPLSCIAAYAEIMLMARDKVSKEHLPALADRVRPDHPLATFLEESKNHLRFISEACDNIERIVASMQTFARRESDRPALHPLRASIDKALKLCAHTLKYHVTTHIDVPPDLPCLLIQPQQIEQVLVNLMNNAAHAIEAQGRDGTLTVSARRSGETVRIVLDDTGPGIPPDTLASIWEPFFTTKGERGTGLGLSISRGIMEEHRGSLTAENRPEGGARFVMTLPVPGPADTADKS